MTFPIPDHIVPRLHGQEALFSNGTGLNCQIVAQASELEGLTAGDDCLYLHVANRCYGINGLDVNKCYDSACSILANWAENDLCDDARDAIDKQLYEASDIDFGSVVHALEQEWGKVLTNRVSWHSNVSREIHLRELRQRALLLSKP